jgi:histidyl-tRNA synthetase
LQALVEGAPRLMSYLGAESRAHFDAVLALLDAAGLAYRINPRLVRGMDYYNLTVFEWVTPHLGSQATVCGGGRYDQLIEQLGGKPAPGVGFGLGIERLLLLLQAVGVQPAAAAPHAYAVVPDPALLTTVMPLLETLRAEGLAVVLNAGGGSMKSQFKRADASGAGHALVFGPDELARGEVAIKPLRDATAQQHSCAIADLAAWARALRDA